MAIDTFELWKGDKNLLEYMLDRCIVAKMIEGTGNLVPDDYSFYSGAPVHEMFQTSYFETINDFLVLAKIGKLTQRELNRRSEYSDCVTIRMFALEELAYYQLTEKQCGDRASWMSNLVSQIEMMDYCHFEGLCTTQGSRIYIRVGFMMGFANEFCEELLELHHNAEKMICSLRNNSKGEN